MDKAHGYPLSSLRDGEDYPRASSILWLLIPLFGSVFLHAQLTNFFALGIPWIKPTATLSRRSATEKTLRGRNSTGTIGFLDDVVAVFVISLKLDPIVNSSMSLQI
jgi:hypothetical protein